MKIRILAWRRRQQRSVDIRAPSRTAVGPGCPQAPPFVAPPVGSTQESISCSRAPSRRPHLERVGQRRCVMQVIYPCCCGLDIHKKFVVACVLTTADDGRVQKATRTFSTMTDDLLALLDWLAAAGCTHVAMESTSSYWRPVYNLLEGQLALLVANAFHVKAVPGRKTDVKDAEWLADLLRHGLIRGSFIPSPAQRHLRDLTRYRTHLVEERARLTNRLQAVLEDANVKLASVVTDIRGASARAMLEALVAGATDPTVLAELARGRLRTKRDALARAVVG